MIEQGKRYFHKLKEHEKLMKTAVVILILITAVVFFSGYGDKDEIPVNIETIPEENGFETESVNKSPSEKEKPSQKKIYVDISGQVKNPGVYQVEEGTRLFEAIEDAGGLLSTAQVDQINQAEILTDGQKIIVPKEGEDISQLPTGVTRDGLININTADSKTLQEIPGVGPVTADKIVDYRSNNGRFNSPEELKNVSGIGEKTFEKIKDKVTT